MAVAESVRRPIASGFRLQPEEAVGGLEQLSGTDWVVKSQINAAGRGKGPLRGGLGRRQRRRRLARSG